jgi:F-type H+-transporting ATPase subunit b
MSRRVLAFVAAFGLGMSALALGSSSLAQQPPGKDPHTLPLGEVQPGARPPQPGPGARPQPGQPGMQPVPLQPGQRPPGLPNRPPPNRPPPRTVEPPAGHGSAQPDHGGHAGGHVCPGHGPLDNPHPPNWWQGLIGSKYDPSMFDEKPDKEGHFHRKDPFVSQLLWRFENDKDECDARNQPPPFLASVLNFGLLAFVIYRFGRKPLRDALVARKQGIMKEIEIADELLEKARKRVEDLEDQLEHLDERSEQLKADYAAQGEAERKHILAEAAERRTRMTRDVDFRIAQELKTAKAQLVHEAVERAVAAANEVLRSSVTQEDRDRAANEYLGGLEAAFKGEAVQEQRAGGAA